MKKGIFGTWFREFATIVFTQTVQAFLLAIVMSVIISSLAGAGKDSIDAAGLLAIIALSSFGKIEMLIKNIFGVTSAFGDPGSLRAGAGITAGTLLAARGVRQISDNVSKFGQARRQINQGKAGLATLKNGEGANGDNKQLTDKTSVENQTENKNIQDEVAKKVEQHAVRLETMGDMDRLAAAIKNLTDATNKANKNDANSQREKYQDMINEGKNLRRSAVRENIGATVGGIVGATSALAEGQNPLERGLAGAGIGDMLGAASAKKTAEKEKYNKEMDKLLSQVKKSGEEGYKEQMQQLAKSINEIETANKNANSLPRNIPVIGGRAREMKKMNNGMNKELREIQKQLDKNTNSGNS